MTSCRTLLSVLILGGGLTPTLFAAPDFAHDIVPILKTHCGKCHTGDQKKGELSFNTRATTLAGGEGGKIVEPGKSAASRLIAVVKSRDPGEQMPPEGERLTEKEVRLLAEWIDAGLPWETGFTFTKSRYEPPLKPRRPKLPAVQDGRSNPIDRIIDAELAKNGKTRPAALDDAAFARRTSLDLIGLLPEALALPKALDDSRPDWRTRWIDALLADDTAYAEHWLTFWNDLLRNDYGGTGFITGGRKQISKWLYRALIDNKPYDQFAQELLAPNADTVGFVDGIKWRGNVSAGQTVEIQFAQSVGQAFLGINLKCASCHDSFIDRWTLDESYGLAAIYSSQPLEIHRCDKPVGKQATAKWMFPELGDINPQAPQPERMKQLAALMTHPDNGRFTRTLVNRLWHRLMGHGIVHPLDAMQTPPWNADLLDFLAVDFAEHGYDIKHTLKLIATSQAYQSQAVVIDPDHAGDDYQYGGPQVKRMTAEQFVDSVWQLTGTAPKKFDIAVQRGKVDPSPTANITLTGKWIWSTSGAEAQPAAGETITVRKTVKLDAAPVRAGAVITADNSFTLFVNGQKIANSDNWEQVESVSLENVLKKGDNEFVIVARNAGNAPNPAAVFFEARWQFETDKSQSLATDETWQWTKSQPDGKGKFKKEPTDWAPVALAANPQIWASRVEKDLAAGLAHGISGPQPMIRAALLKSDFLQRTLGRPNRDQIVSMRPNELSMLEALDLNNSPTLAELLRQGATNIVNQHGNDTGKVVPWLYTFSLSRPPTKEEMSVATDALGPTLTEAGVADLLWTLLMLPEFQLIR
ncbi:MAG TPA: DUF1549 domain-containing protein [Planctomycetaceae bacterium]|nr:DUF1549 domain-containing protein [Planctomycetaceae bacterium]